jgi:hypothetical protein
VGLFRVCVPSVDWHLSSKHGSDSSGSPKHALQLGRKRTVLIDPHYFRPHFSLSFVSSEQRPPFRLISFPRWQREGGQPSPLTPPLVFCGQLRSFALPCPVASGRGIIAVPPPAPGALVAGRRAGRPRRPRAPTSVRWLGGERRGDALGMTMRDKATGKTMGK